MGELFAKYVYGTAAVQDEYVSEQEQRAQRARGKVKALKKQEAALRMDLPYVIILTVAAIITLGICVNYLRLQSQITTSLKNIEAQEKILEELTTDNDALEARIEAGINLDEIYTVATEDLGMVYANKNQVLTYDKTPTEYVRQDENITE